MTKYLLLLLACALTLSAEPPHRVSVAFSNPTAPKRLICSLVNGRITVKAHAAKDVIVEASSGDGGAPRVEEADNTIRIAASPQSRSLQVTIFAPADTALKLNSVNGGISVEEMAAEIDAGTVNGEINLRRISGAAVIHTTNGRLIATLESVAANKPQSFTTFNGSIDVTLPAATKATLKLKTGHGEIHSDFEMIRQADPPLGRGKGQPVMTGILNGGGAEFQFTSYNGSIHIRKQP